MEKISSPRERRKWNLGQLEKALGLTCVQSQSSRPGKNNATVSEFPIFLRINNSRDQFLLRLTLFLPYLKLAVKIFEFLRLSTKFLAVLHLSVNPIETLLLVLIVFRIKQFFSQLIIT